MNRFLIKLLLAFVAIILPFVAISASACSCGRIPSPYEAYHEATAVFVGKALGFKDGPLVRQSGDKTYTYTERRFRFAVVEQLKNAKTPELEVGAGDPENMCYTGFVVGESYLVYAYGDQHRLASGFCARTSELSFAEDELHFLRGLLNGKPEPRVYGSVTRVDNHPSKSVVRVVPIEGVKILIKGEGRTFEAVTDKHGRYSLDRVPDGRYTARPVLTERYTSFFPAEEEFVLGSEPQDSYVKQGTGVYAGFRVGWNNRISGRVVDSEGNPIVRSKVAVVVLRDATPVVVKEDMHFYNTDGKYSFSALTPGKYLLSVKIGSPLGDKDKLLHFYYPHSDDLAQASEILIGENETVEGRDIRLPPGYVLRPVEGVVVRPNGVPVSRGWVFLADSKDSGNASDNKFDWVSTDELGRFTLQGFVGAEYWLHAEIVRAGKAEPIKIKVGKVNEPLKLVIPFAKREEP